jgi:hypothetical protein
VGRPVYGDDASVGRNRCTDRLQRAHVQFRQLRTGELFTGSCRKHHLLPLLVDDRQSFAVAADSQSSDLTDRQSGSQVASLRVPDADGPADRIVGRRHGRATRQGDARRLPLCIGITSREWRGWLTG